MLEIACVVSLVIVICLGYFVIKMSMDIQLLKNELANQKAKNRSLLDYIDRLTKKKK